MRSVFTRFGKAVKDSFGLSFSRSARDNCDRRCRLWDACYASRIERFYKDVAPKLARHYRNGPMWVVNQAIATLPDKPIRWARLSVDGSLPSRAKFGSARKWCAFVKQLRTLITMAQDLGADWHVPVESYGKARSYRAAFAGLGIVVRRTSQARTVSELLKSTDHRSWVVATKIHKSCVTKKEKQQNTDLAYQMAEVVRSAGQSCVVCPAIARDSKCGDCLACANPKVDVVLYPFHA